MKQIKVIIAITFIFISTPPILVLYYKTKLLKRLVNSSLYNLVLKRINSIQKNKFQSIISYFYANCNINIYCNYILEPKRAVFRQPPSTLLKAENPYCTNNSYDRAEKSMQHTELNLKLFLSELDCIYQKKSQHQ